MSTGTFVTFTAPHAVTMTQQEVAKPGPTEIVIEAEVSLISAGTERSFLNAAPYYPFFPGYSLVGRVAQKGERVTRFDVGDRVAASAAHGSLVLCDEQMAFAVPDGVAPEHAAFMTVGATALYAVRLARLSIGDPILIVGQGLIGQIASQIARQAGALPVIGTDTVAARLDLSRSLGTDIVFDALDADGLAQCLAALPGGGVAATIDFSGAPGILDLGVNATRRRGRVVAAALNLSGSKVDIYGLAFLKGISLTGAFFNARPWRLDAAEVTPPFDWPPRPAGSAEFEGNDIGTSAGDSAAVLRLIEHRRLNVAPLITDIVLPEDAPALFAKLPATGFLGGIIEWSGNSR